MSGNFCGRTRANKASYDLALAAARKIGKVLGVRPRTIRINGSKEKHWCVWVEVEVEVGGFWGGGRPILRRTIKRKFLPRYDKW